MKLGIRESIDKIKTFSRIFVERPRFAMVIAIVLTMAGVMSITWLPISQYPRLTPPTISVMYNYPGANAKEILNTVIRARTRRRSSTRWPCRSRTR